MESILTIALLVACIGFVHVKECKDDSAFFCKHADCSKPIFQSRCCTTCSGPNPPTQVPPIFTKRPKTCGRKMIQTARIVGGENTMPGAWPWSALIFYKNYRSCGATIISSQYVVTAAHCIPTLAKPQDFIIRVGEYDINERKEKYEVDHEAIKIFVKPGYSGITRDKDIALLKLKSPIKFNTHVQPVCLPFNDVSLDAECYVTGWGKTSHVGSSQDVLKQTKSTVVTNQDCWKLNKGEQQRMMTKNMLCAGNPSEKSTVCHGDAGGGLACRSGTNWVLHGVLSFGHSQCDSNSFYPLYTRVRNFRVWLEETMAKN